MAEYISSLTGAQMDAALLDMNNHVSEAWAVGQRGGTAVGSTDPTYHNNSKYYSEAAATAAGHYPYIDEDTNHWMVWDTSTSAYTDTGVTAEGEKGDTGDKAEVTATEYQASASGSVTPTGTWTTTIPTVQGGQYLWMRLTWNTTPATYSYTVARQGVDGTGQGDMTKTVYDADNTVADAGGIKDFVEEQALSGSADPTTATVGYVGQFYTNTTTNGLFQCTEVSGSTYTWASVGGGNITIDPTPTSGSTNAVQSGGVYTALQGKQDTLTFDSAPTSGSTNPVTSGGVKSYVDTQDGRRTRTDITNNLTNLSTAIAEQNLEKYGYAIGDYFTGASGYTYYLADMDTAYGGYNSYGVVGTHHCGVVVDTHSITTWLSSGSASSYSASTLHSFLTNTALPLIKSDITALFGDWSSHMLARNVIDNSVGGWGTTWTGLANCYLTAMSEVQMYGARVFGCDGNQTGTEAKPLELFMKYRWNEIYGNASVWLKSLYSASHACIASDYGFAIIDGLAYAYRASGLILLY